MNYYLKDMKDLENFKGYNLIYSLFYIMCYIMIEYNLNVDTHIIYLI